MDERLIPIHPAAVTIAQGITGSANEQRGRNCQQTAAHSHTPTEVLCMDRGRSYGMQLSGSSTSR